MSEEILSVFEKKLRLKGLAKTTIKNYVQAIKDYFKYYSGDIITSEVSDYLNEKKKLVDNSPNRYICYTQIGKIIKEAGQRIGIENWHPHLLRHTGASHLDDADISTRKIQRLLGHSKITTTQIYLHPTQDAVLEVKNPLDNDKRLVSG